MRTTTRPRGAARPYRPDPLLAARVRAPRPRFPLLARPRLDARLTAAVRHRVTVVRALAGAGKTTACATWAYGTADHDVAWLTADATDDAARVRTGVRAALAGIGAAWAAALRAEPGAAPGDRAFVTEVADALARAARPVVLVVDEADALDTDARAPLDALVAHAPPALRLVLVGRRRPPLRLARLRVSGDLAELDTTDLACDEREAAGYLGLTEAGDLTPAELLAATDGWLAAMRLWSDHAALGEYVRDEVLDDRPETREVLAGVSVVDRVTPDLAVALTGRADAAGLLDDLAADGVLVRDGADGWLRCRAPVTAALDEPDRRADLLRTAAEWYAAHGRGTEAVRTAARTGDPLLTSRILLDTCIPIAAGHGAPHLDALLDEVGGAVSDTGAGAGAGTGAGGARSGARGGASEAVRAVARVFAGDVEGARRPAAAAVAGGALAPLVRAKRATLDLLLGDTAAPPARARVPAARTGTPEVARAWGEYAFFAGLRWVALGDLRAAAGEFATAAGLADAPGGWGTRATAWGALALAWRGDLGAAERLGATCTVATPGAASVRGTPGAPGTSGTPGAPGAEVWPAAVARAWVCLERDDPRGADDAVRGIDGTIPVLPGEPVAVALAGVVRARAAIARGELDDARATLDGLSDAELGPYGTALRTGARVELAQRSGDVTRARALAHALTGDAPAASAAVLLGRVLLQADEPRAAIEAVSGLLGPAGPDAGVGERDGPDVGAGERVGALAVAAAAYGRLRAAEDAARLLEEALGAAGGEAAYGALLACGAPLRALVTMVKPTDAGQDRVRRELLRRFDLRPAAGGRTPPAGSGATVDEEPLTRAELAVLRFLPSHMTNTEIADALVVSVNTVKTHLRAVYRKLGVATRRDAIRAADALGLL